MIRILLLSSYETLLDEHGLYRTSTDVFCQGCCITNKLHHFDRHIPLRTIRSKTGGNKRVDFFYYKDYCYMGWLTLILNSALPYEKGRDCAIKFRRHETKKAVKSVRNEKRCSIIV